MRRCPILIVMALFAVSLLFPARAQDTASPESESASSLGKSTGSATTSFAIKPQAMESALDAYSAATGVQVFYESRFVAGRQSPGVTGQQTPDAALRTLVADSPLAPVETAPRSFVLVLKDADPQQLARLNPADIKAPVMHLDALHVEAPTPVNHDLYAAIVQYAISNALKRDADVRRTRYRAEIMVWLSVTGTIQRTEVEMLDDDDSVGQALKDALNGLTIPHSPPPDLDLPILVLVSTH